MNELIYIKHWEECLACSKNSYYLLLLLLLLLLFPLKWGLRFINKQFPHKRPYAKWYSLMGYSTYKSISKHVKKNIFRPGFIALLVSNWFEKKGSSTDPERLELRADKIGGHLSLSS